ncbi:FecR family protein [Emcibacter sp.]|uniref:FecR family protein n=1 Tax=Emcibacter sp. TaxID=1979954 RepID=UPI002AA81557|nr:FecR domain-containing protein [Emcibacter sp.]
MSIVEDMDMDLDLEDQARRWYQRLQEDAGNDDLRDAFLAWYEKDERHREIYEEVASFWLDIDEIIDSDMQHADIENDLVEFDRSWDSAGTAEVHVTDITAIREAGDKVANIDFHRSGRTQNKNFLSGNFARLAAAIAVLVSLSVIFYGYSRYLPEGTYRTDVGEQARFELADGSSIFMNTDSLVREEYSENLRKVVLLRGEAIFDVEKDPSRPFVVETNHGAARAVGTSFSVYERRDKVEVVVIEGTVAMHHNEDLRELMHTTDKQDQEKVLVTAGQKVFAYDGRVGAVSQATELDLDRLYFSQQGKIIFRGQPLSEIVREMARYTNKKIIITDATIKQMKMGGAFDIDDFDAFINAVEDAFPVKVIRVTPFVTFITEA